MILGPNSSHFLHEKKNLPFVIKIILESNMFKKYLSYFNAIHILLK